MNLVPYAELCVASYLPDIRPFTEDADKLTHVFISQIEGRPCFTYEGTHDIEEWLWRDFLVLGMTTFEHAEFGTLHDGIAKGALGTVDAIAGYLSEQGWPAFDLVGHSKGAGECLVAAAELKRRGHAPHFFASFEAPHVGTGKLRDYMADINGIETATYNSHGRDLVTCVPWSTPIIGWGSMKDRIQLAVPDTYDLATKHRIPAVLAAVRSLPA